MNIFSKIFLCFTVYSLSVLSLLYANENCINEKITAKYANVNWKHQCLSHNLVLITRLPPVKQTNVVDKNGRTVFSPMTFDRIWNAGVLISFIGEYGDLYFYDATGKEKYRYEYIGSFTDDIAIILAKEKNKVVLVDIEGKIISPNYDFLSPISEGLAVVANDGVFGYLNEHLEMVIPLQFDLAQPFSNGLASVRKDGKYGFINQTGQVVIHFIYDDSSVAFSNGLIAVKKQTKWGLIDTIGNTISPFIYDDIWAFSVGLAIVKRAGKRGFINANGKEIIPVQFDDATSFYQGAARVKIDEQWGLINKEGKNLSQFAYDTINPIFANLAQTTLSGKHGLIDRKTGNELLPPEYDAINIWNTKKNKWLKTEKDKLMGLYDLHHQEEILAPKYTKIKIKNEFVLEVWKEAFSSLFYFPNKQFIIPWGSWKQRTFWCDAGRFSNGKEQTLINFRTGETIIPLGQYEQIDDFSPCVVRVLKNSKQGLISSKTKAILLPIEYDSIYGVAKGFARIRKGEQEGLIKTDGTILIPLGNQNIITVIDGYIVMMKNNEKIKIPLHE